MKYAQVMKKLYSAKSTVDSLNEALGHDELFFTDSTGTGEGLLIVQGLSQAPITTQGQLDFVLNASDSEIEEWMSKNGI